jgi:HTH-type transcriptional regulator, competence development regulator
MLTSFGKLVRTIRIEKEVNLKQMAELLDKTPAFLSAVETGRKNVPGDLVKEIARKLALNEKQETELELAALKSRSEVSISMKRLDERQKEVVAAFARNFNSIESDDLEKLKKLLSKSSGTTEV